MRYDIRQEVLNIEKYVTGKPISEVKREFGLSEVIKLASNENPLGCSPKVKKALMNLLNEVAIYPDASAYELKNCLADKFGVKPEQIFCGAGSDSLIKVVCNTLLNPGDESIMGAITFPRYETNTKLMSAVPIKVPMKGLVLDVYKMVEAITPKTKLIWFCNPNNPTGSIFNKNDLNRVLPKIPSNVYFVMDEAYAEYVTEEDYPDSLKLLEQYPNMIILRTFSKAYGLASLRLGYGIANKELVGYFNRVINSFDANQFAQVAAVAALKDEEFLSLVQKTNTAGRNYLTSEFDKMGLSYVPSKANFILVNVNGDDKPIFDYLLRCGCIVRPGFLLEVPGWLRVSIGTKEQNKCFVKLLKEAIENRDKKLIP